MFIETNQNIDFSHNIIDNNFVNGSSILKNFKPSDCPISPNNNPMNNSFIFYNNTISNNIANSGTSGISIDCMTTVNISNSIFLNNINYGL
jgi:hypothetical protein